MTQKFISQNNSNSLLLFFAGWGMDENPFKDFKIKNVDLMICYDYRKLDFDFSLIKKYNSIKLVAWSMGIWAASKVFENKQTYICNSLAINGTNIPVNNELGINENIFESTLAGLSDINLIKFQRRMCGKDFNIFRNKSPNRRLEELKEELAAIGNISRTSDIPKFVWAKAIIGINDKIFSALNQERAWLIDNTPTERTEDEHYSESLFRKIIEC